MPAPAKKTAPRKATKATRAATATTNRTRTTATVEPTAIVVEMEYSKATSGTYVYAEMEDGTAVRTLYVRKDAFAGKAPDSITVTITPDPGNVGRTN